MYIGHSLLFSGDYILLVIAPIPSRFNSAVSVDMINQSINQSVGILKWHTVNTTARTTVEKMMSAIC